MRLLEYFGGVSSEKKVKNKFFWDQKDLSLDVAGGHTSKWWSSSLYFFQQKKKWTDNVLFIPFKEREKKKPRPNLCLPNFILFFTG